MKIEVLKEELKGIKEPRRTRYGNIRHKLEDIIIIGLCTIICQGEDYVDMEAFGKERETWLKTFLELPNGIPDSDTFRRVFERLDPIELSKCLTNWLETTREKREKRSIVAVDGKTIRGSENANHKAYHVVSQTADKPLLEITLRQNNQAEPSKALFCTFFKGISASSGQLFSAIRHMDFLHGLCQ